MTNAWCYKHLIEKTKPKNIFKRIYYKIWLWCGVSPSGLITYEFTLGETLKRSETNDKSNI